MAVLKIKDSLGNWNDITAIKGAKGDTGDPGVSVSNAAINSNGHLIITLSNGTTFDAGVVVGGVSSWDASTQTLNIVG